MSRFGRRTNNAHEFMAEKSLAPLFCRDPPPGGPGRVMTNMLRMAAFQFADPEAVFALSKADNPAPHKGY
jgi:hypothetical protein